MKVLEFLEFCNDKNNVHMADLVLSKNEYTTLHSHDFYEIFVVTKGQFRHNYNGVFENIKEGQFKIIRPEDEHFFIGEGVNNILRNIAVHSDYFSNIILESCIGDQHYNSLYSLNEIVLKSFNYKSNMMINSEKDHRRYLLESLISDLMINIFLDASSDERIPLWLRKAYENMKFKENFLVGIKRFVLLSGKTQEHLTRELKKYYGVSPSEYVNSLRLNEATKLLIQGNLPIIDIIFNCGFNNIGYFNRIFKGRYGITPREYRKLNKKLF